MSLNMLIETPAGLDRSGVDCSYWMREIGFRETCVEPSWVSTRWRWGSNGARVEVHPLGLMQRVGVLCRRIIRASPLAPSAGAN